VQTAMFLEQNTSGDCSSLASFRNVLHAMAAGATAPAKVFVEGLKAGAFTLPRKCGKAGMSPRIVRLVFLHHCQRGDHALVQQGSALLKHIALSGREARRECSTHQGRRSKAIHRISEEIRASSSEDFPETHPDHEVDPVNAHAQGVPETSSPAIATRDAAAVEMTSSQHRGQTSQGCDLRTST
jgi:hypothetical protein